MNAQDLQIHPSKLINNFNKNIFSMCSMHIHVSANVVKESLKIILLVILSDTGISVKYSKITHGEVTLLRVLVESQLSWMVRRPSGGGADAGNSGCNGHHKLARNNDEKEALTVKMKLKE